MLGGSSITDIIYVIVAIVISLSIHEAMHAYASHLLGDTTAQERGRLSLNPLKHIDPFATVVLPIITYVIFKIPILAAKPVPFNPDRLKFGEFGAALVAIAGPLSNILMAFIGALILAHVGASTQVVDFLETFVIINVAIFVFNIIPIPPLDGSRVLYAFAPEAVQDFMRSIEPYGIFIVFALVLTGVITPIIANIDNAILQNLP
ncbi:MAG TPA: site-2 protease family protein [Candidatus Sulfotelmatobacter sp.]|nr:site-2 protease family protein [Candidatus Sulfotelmatobacter sp.]